MLYLLLMKFSLRKTSQCLIQAEQNAQKNNSALYIEDYMNHMSDDESKVTQKRTPTSGIFANLGEEVKLGTLPTELQELGEEVVSQDDGSVEPKGKL